MNEDVSIADTITHINPDLSGAALWCWVCVSDLRNAFSGESMILKAGLENVANLAILS